MQQDDYSIAVRMMLETYRLVLESNDIRAQIADRTRVTLFTIEKTERAIVRTDRILSEFRQFTWPTVGV